LLYGNTIVRFTPSENRLFQTLLEQPGQVVLTQTLKKNNQLSLKMARQHLGALRQKLWVCELDVECIYGKGYRLSSFAPGTPQPE
jgi:DNA-binding response OmpR family regulator